MTGWQDDAACRGMDNAPFFPVDRGPNNYDAAMAVCHRCQVRFECLKYALKHKIDEGVWGGTSERQRLRMRRYTQENRRVSDVPTCHTIVGT